MDPDAGGIANALPLRDAEARPLVDYRDLEFNGAVARARRGLLRTGDLLSKLTSNRESDKQQYGEN